MMKLPVPLIPGVNTFPALKPARVESTNAAADFAAGMRNANLMMCQGAVNAWVGITRPMIVSGLSFISSRGSACSARISFTAAPSSCANCSSHFAARKEFPVPVVK